MSDEKNEPVVDSVPDAPVVDPPKPTETDDAERTRRSTRSASKQAAETLKNIIGEDVEESRPSGKKKKEPTKDVQVLGGLFNCEYQSEDTELIEDDQADVKHLFVNVVFNQDFGEGIKKGDQFAAVAIDFNAGRMEFWALDDTRVHVIDFGINIQRVVPENEWPEEVLATYDEESDGSFEDDYDSEDYDSEDDGSADSGDEILSDEEEEDSEEDEDSDYSESTESETETETEPESESSTSSESSRERSKKRKRKSSSKHRSSKKRKY